MNGMDSGQRETMLGHLPVPSARSTASQNTPPGATAPSPSTRVCLGSWTLRRVADSWRPRVESR